MELTVGAVFEGKVKSITNFGAFISQPENKTGMVHISEVANTYVSDIREHLTEGQDVVVEEGVAKLMDRSAFAGSVATMDRVVRTVQRLTERPLEEIIISVTETPARIMGCADRKGAIEVGKDADIVIFDEDINICHTIIGGEVFYSKQ